jgi:hypothetical protein
MVPAACQSMQRSRALMIDQNTCTDGCVGATHHTHPHTYTHRAHRATNEGGRRIAVSADVCVDIARFFDATLQQAASTRTTCASHPTAVYSLLALLCNAAQAWYSRVSWPGGTIGEQTLAERHPDAETLHLPSAVSPPPFLARCALHRPGVTVLIDITLTTVSALTRREGLRQRASLSMLAADQQRQR